MQINLIQAEIHEALAEYINKDYDLSAKDVRITLVAGRGKKGHSASIDILPPGTLDKEAEIKALGEEKPEDKKVDKDTPAINF